MGEAACSNVAEGMLGTPLHSQGLACRMFTSHCQLRLPACQACARSVSRALSTTRWWTSSSAPSRPGAPTCCCSLRRVSVWCCHGLIALACPCHVMPCSAMRTMLLSKRLMLHHATSMRGMPDSCHIHAMPCYPHAMPHPCRGMPCPRHASHAACPPTDLLFRTLPTTTPSTCWRGTGPSWPASTVGWGWG